MTLEVIVKSCAYGRAGWQAIGLHGVAEYLPLFCVVFVTLNNLSEPKQTSLKFRFENLRFNTPSRYLILRVASTGKNHSGDKFGNTSHNFFHRLHHCSKVSSMATEMLPWNVVDGFNMGIRGHNYI